MSGVTDVARIWVVAVESFCGAGTGNSVVSTGGVVRGNRHIGDELSVKSAGATITTVLANGFFSARTSAASGSFTI